ncbi:DUF2259 domain-containing protein [Pseudomonas sp. R2.Fl]|nr:DUF2259 domain-containing protein [Pseudomonas sp. R2.Fl]
MRKGTGGWLAALAIAALGSSGPAFAGDIAAVNPLGFSPDGKIFAFEQYGIQDGSGFPYSEIFVIDTQADSYLPGTPYRIRIDDENAGLSEARAKSLDRARPLLQQHRAGDHPGNLVAFNPVSELDDDPHRLRYRAYPAEPAFGGAYALELEEFDQTPSASCKDMLETVKGFRLRLAESDDKPASAMLHEDTAVPQSRRCPTGYRLGGVVTFHPTQGETVHVALVLVLSYGFEGRDGRWIAVPYRP